MLSDEQLNEIRDLIKSGNKIQAIKMYRDHTGRSLGDVKDLIDQLELGNDQQNEGTDQGSTADSSLSPEQINEINSHLFGGNKIHAIKVYREHSGKGLKDSKEFIDQIEAELRQRMPEKFSAPAAKGCSWLFVIVSAAIAILPQMI